MKRKNLYWFFLYLCIAIICIIVFLSSPLFNIRAININNNDVVTETQIINMIGDTNNMLAFSKRNAINSIYNSPYIESVSISKDYINREIYIDIVERVTIGYIQFSQDIFLFIDKEGRVLEVNSFFTKPLPIVVGLNFSEFTLGEILEIENEDAFYIVSTLAYLFDIYNIEQDIVRVDVSDPQNIHFYYGQIAINMGNVEDIDKKVRIVNSILPEIIHWKNIGGNLDVTDINNSWVFQILT